MKGLSVEVKEDGVWLRFDSSSGKSTIVDAETIAETYRRSRRRLFGSGLKIKRSQKSSMPERCPS